MANSPVKQNDIRSKAREMMEIMHAAVEEAQEESRCLGIPNVYEIDGQIYYELPSGELSLEDPYPARQKPNGSAG